jgi:hypothetical protein
MAANRCVNVHCTYIVNHDIVCILVEIAIVFIILTYLCSVLKVFDVVHILSTSLECHPCIVELQATWPVGRYNPPHAGVDFIHQSGIYDSATGRATNSATHLRYQATHFLCVVTRLPCLPNGQYSPHHPILGLIKEILKNPRSLRYILIRFSTRLML